LTFDPVHYREHRDQNIGQLGGGTTPGIFPKPNRVSIAYTSSITKFGRIHCPHDPFPKSRNPYLITTEDIRVFGILIVINHGFPKFTIILNISLDPGCQETEIHIGEVRDTKATKFLFLHMSPQLAKCNFLWPS
jgi:hypothetical protein